MNTQIGANSSTQFATTSAPVRSGKPKLSLLPRRRLITSISQAAIVTSLAISILTFVISLLEFLPVRQTDYSKLESLQYNTFICVVIPVVLAYCSQSKVVSALTQRWIHAKGCSAPECL